MLDLIENFCCVVFPLVLHGFVWEISNTFMHYQPDKKQALTGPHWLVGIVVNHGLDQIRQFFSYQNDQSEASDMSYLRNQHWTHPTLFKFSVLPSDWHLNIVKSLHWSFQSECQAVRHSVSKFLEEWIASKSCFSQKQWLTDSNLFHSRQNLKQTKGMREINNLKWWPINEYIKVNIYIYIYMCVCVCVCVQDMHCLPNKNYSMYFINALFVSVISYNSFRRLWNCTNYDVHLRLIIRHSPLKTCYSCYIIKEWLFFILIIFR